MTNNSPAIKLTLQISSFIVKLLLNIMFYIIVVIAIVNFSKMAYEFTYQLYGPDTVDPVGTGRQIIFQIKKGESTMDIASKLEVNRAVKSKYSFYLKTKLNNYAIMPGTYQISSDMTYDQILAVITDYSASIIKEKDTGTGTGTSSDTGSGTSDTNTGTNTDSNTNTGTRYQSGLI
ncbi:MAG TPA: endolytic transglycosylase MltG [Mobilitalea sp.]|nr:endolytic transglycosylase MltG [Mobilitalea sp.]